MGFFECYLERLEPKNWRNMALNYLVLELEFSNMGTVSRPERRLSWLSDERQRIFAIHEWFGRMSARLSR